MLDQWSFIKSWCRWRSGGVGIIFASPLYCCNISNRGSNWLACSTWLKGRNSGRNGFSGADGKPAANLAYHVEMPGTAASPCRNHNEMSCGDVMAGTSSLFQRELLNVFRKHFSAIDITFHVFKFQSVRQWAGRVSAQAWKYRWAWNGELLEINQTSLRHRALSPMRPLEISKQSVMLPL